MAKGERRGNRKTKKPKKEKIKVIAAAPARKSRTGSRASPLAKRNSGCLGEPAARIGRRPISGELHAASRWD
jgi:hypothetical protein